VTTPFAGDDVDLAAFRLNARHYATTPLAGLVKSQVRELAAALGAPEQLVKKVPTADLEELSPGKPDEDAHGVSYQHIDAFLQGRDVPDEAARIIVDTYDKSAHKRQLPKEPKKG